MADDPHNTSDVSDPVDTTTATEDAETTAARRELKHTTISEKAGDDAEKGQGQLSSQEDQSGSDNDEAKAPKDKAAADRKATPDTDSGDVRTDYLREQVSSPKKKRAHDELVADGSSTEGEESSKPRSTAVAQSRTEESEPEKKRPRDRESTRRRSQDGEVGTFPTFCSGFHIVALTRTDFNIGVGWLSTIELGQVKEPTARREQGSQRGQAPDISVGICQLRVCQACKLIDISVRCTGWCRKAKHIRLSFLRILQHAGRAKATSGTCYNDHTGTETHIWG